MTRPNHSHLSNQVEKESQQQQQPATTLTNNNTQTEIFLRQKNDVEQTQEDKCRKAATKKMKSSKMKDKTECNT